MAVLTEERIGELLAPFLPPEVGNSVLLSGLSHYLDLLMHWNARTNLTAVRDPEMLVQRHMGESLFAAQSLPAEGSLLDFGSGAGFPGVPMQLMHRSMVVTLAESQGKKASFLREAVRELGLRSEVWPKRVEELPAGRSFDVVTLRAVDRSKGVLPVAEARVTAGGRMMRFLPAEAEFRRPCWRVLSESRLPVFGGRVVQFERVSATDGEGAGLS